MDKRKICLGSFSKETFDVLVHGLTREGYVIDGRKVLGLSFSSTQIEHLDQEVFDQLCNLFGRESDLKLESGGNYAPSQGATYIIYDASVHNHCSASQILENYVNKLTIE